MPDNFSDQALRGLASTASLILALVLVTIKSWGWLATDSISLLTSAVDALVDVVASIVTFAGVRYAGRSADSRHRFGHGKAEAVAALIQALLLAVVAAALGVESIKRLVTPQPLSEVGLGIWIILGSTIAAMALVRLQTYVVNRTKSTAIAADRAHYVTDVAVNLVVLCALVVHRYTGWVRVDAVGALAIACYMLWNARGIALHSLIQLLDRELEVADREHIKAAVLGCAGVCAVHDLRTRDGGDRVFVEFHVEVDGGISVNDGHDIVDATEEAVRQLFIRGADVIAHLEPAGIDDKRLDDLVE